MKTSIKEKKVERSSAVHIYLLFHKKYIIFYYCLKFLKSMICCLIFFNKFLLLSLIL